jgi:hypothetical protein
MSRCGFLAFVTYPYLILTAKPDSSPSRQAPTSSQAAYRQSARDERCWTVRHRFGNEGLASARRARANYDLGMPEMESRAVSRQTLVVEWLHDCYWTSHILITSGGTGTAKYGEISAAIA